MKPVREAVAGRWPWPGGSWRTRRTTARTSFGFAAVLLLVAALLVAALRLWDTAMAWFGPLAACAILAARWAFRRGWIAASWRRERERAAQILLEGAPAVAIDGEVRAGLDRRSPIARGEGFAWGMCMCTGVPCVWFGISVLPEPGAIPILVCGAAALAWPVIRLVRFAWMGGLDVQWETATLRPGGRAVFYVGTTGGATHLEDPWLLLRCVRAWGTGRSAGARAVWENEIIAEPRDESPGDNAFARATFDIPAELPGSALDAEAPVWWELIVHGRTTWGVLTESFLVPVIEA